MNYEQKYKEALERAKGAHNSAKSDKENGIIDEITEYTIQLTETIFPELKESEDEKMKKSIIYALRNGGFYNNDKTDEAIAWLEKQGEQKSINDLTQQETMNIADTKFKFGDWIVYNRNDHWQDVRERAAIAAMQGMLSDGRQVHVSHVIKYSIICADELVKRLKGE